MPKGESTPTQLDRRKGLLINRRAEGDSRTGVFYCDCDCGAKNVRVSARRFNDGNVTACPECVRKGLAPNLYPHHPDRRSVTLEPEPLAVLGIDVGLEKNKSGRLVGDLVQDLAAVVGEVAAGHLLEPEQWRALAAALRKKPELLESPMTPKARLYLIVQEALGEQEAIRLAGETDSLFSLAVLAALRWRMDHWDDKGNWWELSQRTGTE